MYKFPPVRHRYIADSDIRLYYYDDKIIGESIRCTGYWEKELTKYIIEQCKDTDGVILDIGAHIGYFSTILAKYNPKATVYAFEPNMHMSTIMLMNVRDFKNIKPIYYGVAPQVSEEVLYSSFNNTGNNSIDKAECNKDVVGYELKCVFEPINSDKFGIDLSKVKIVKIDTQGSELEILIHLRQYLPKDVTYIVESSPELYKYLNAEDIMDGYSAIPYTVFSHNIPDSDEADLVFTI